MSSSKTVLTALFTTSLIIVLVLLITPDKSWSYNPSLELMQRNYYFYATTDNCEMTRNFTTTSYTNALLIERAKQTERRSGFKGMFNHAVSVIQNQLNREEKALLILIIVDYAIFLFFVDKALNWIANKTCPLSDDVTTPSQQRPRQAPVIMRPSRNQQPGIHRYKTKSTLMKTNDALPPYQTI